MGTAQRSGSIEPDLCAIPMVEMMETGRPIRGREIELSRPGEERLVVLADIDLVRDPSGGVSGAIGGFQDITAAVRKAEAEALSDSLRRMSDVLQALPSAIYITDAEGRLTFYNEAAAEFWGLRPTVGEARWCGSWKLNAPDGAALAHDQCPMAIALREGRAVRGYEGVAERPDGRRSPFKPFPTPLYDARGRLVGAVNTLVDMTDERAAERRQRRLVHELDHRVRNSLATVQSLAAGTGRSGDSIEAFRLAFSARLGALTKAHNLLTGRHWEGCDLRAVVEQALGPAAESDGRVSLSGDPVELGPRASLTLAMVVHELADNAARHGALSATCGSVDVGWRMDQVPGETGQLTLIWVESGGPPASAPERKGFGLRLIGRSLANELGGEAVLDFAAGGLTCTLRFPVIQEAPLD